jgi:hypothetical protein
VLLYLFGRSEEFRTAPLFHKNRERESPVSVSSPYFLSADSTHPNSMVMLRVAAEVEAIFGRRGMYGVMQSDDASSSRRRYIFGEKKKVHKSCLHNAKMSAPASVQFFHCETVDGRRGSIKQCEGVGLVWKTQEAK